MNYLIKSLFRMMVAGAVVALLVPAQVSADPVDSVADVVLGQPDFVTRTLNTGGLSASGLHAPRGAAVDGFGNVFVADRNNHRVLVYLDPVTTGMAADIVLGQADFVTDSCNTGGLSASSLCSPEGVAADADGNVYVADTNNSRVLVYMPPLATGMAADLVLGQVDFVTNPGNIGASSLRAPRGVAVDAGGNVYVADTGFNRVTVYMPPLATGMATGLVLGQPDLVSNGFNTGGLSASSMGAPRGVAVDAGGNVYVADTSNHRVLAYLDPLATGMAADLQFGQADFVTRTCNIGASGLCVPFGVAVDTIGNVYVADGNQRVLEYFIPLFTNTAADLVLGQVDFVTNTCNASGLSASSLCGSTGVAVDAGGNIYVADNGNHRVLVYDGFLPGIITDPTGDTDIPEIDIQTADISDDGTTLSCILDVATTTGLLNKSTFRCHIDFDDEENSDFAGKGCDLAASTPYRLGTNSLCTTSDITLTYRIGKRGGSCTGLPTVMCSELETDAEDDPDNFCDGFVGSDVAVSCTITITGSLDDIANVRDFECSVGECLTDKDGTTGEYDVYGFFDSQYRGDRDRVLDTDDNNKPNVVGEVTTVTLLDPTLP